MGLKRVVCAFELTNRVIYRDFRQSSLHGKLSRDALSCSTFRTYRETLRQNLQNRVMSPRDHQINRAGRLAAVNYLDCRKFGSMLAWTDVVRHRLESSRAKSTRVRACIQTCNKISRREIFVCEFFARFFVITYSLQLQVAGSSFFFHGTISGNPRLLSGLWRNPSTTFENLPQRRIIPSPFIILFVILYRSS